ncbi:hypothetical protein K2173_023064 [Erythroxylum novogranatense]|uniref:BRCT domain-containing protein n=1 Tax=Erythroxylum novogranatense TaxID=1862640 RepID=A0AAV8T9H8_9ROSI|nr:hypothetical protein K2173_023064 [Erythroxylum novogranatense]
MAKTFKGANVFMSRNLVPPEVFDAVLDALKLNGANVFLCCDPSRNGPNDFHIISSPDHEKFEDLRSKACNLLGPQCVLSCAKERRPFPKQGFTCCLAMDGVKVLASGFDMDEKAKIEKLVTAMGGILITNASLDVGFVVVKNVLAAKYKWASNILKKPIVTVNWLYQCWSEHRVVSQEPYKVLPFSGLVISVTGIPADERKEVEKLIIQNGGKYSRDLYKSCTHLICDISFPLLSEEKNCLLRFKLGVSFSISIYYFTSPKGDKYKVAVRWGHINIVSRKWFDQSVARKACLNEESYRVQGNSVSLNRTTRDSSMAQHSQDKSIGNTTHVPSSVAVESNLPAFAHVGSSDPELEATLSQNMSSMFSDPSLFVKEEDTESPAVQAADETNLNGCVADDSQSEDGDMYLSDCRISLVGFEASALRKLVNMVREGGGSRYISSSDRLTHIVVGAPSEAEKRELRLLAASGVIHVVRTAWLEDCHCRKKEMPVLQQHLAYNLLLPKDPVTNNKGAMVGMASMNLGKIPRNNPDIHSDQLVGSTNTCYGIPSSLGKNRVDKTEIGMDESIAVTETGKQSQQHLFSVVDDPKKSRTTIQHDSSDHGIPNRESDSLFKGKRFCFSKSFPEDRKSEIFEWITEGGGEVVNDDLLQNVHFLVECHGVIVRSADSHQTTCVSSHWIRSCLEAECLLDVGSHIIYSPLPCWVPLPGFENFRFCISQYEEKDRSLLRNLCFVLGAKFVEKLTRKVTHLLCKFMKGPKYEAACKWGICSITCEWIYECVRQNKVVAINSFCPKEATSQDQESGLCTVSQFPTQSGGMINGESTSQLMSQSQDIRKTSGQIGSGRGVCVRQELQQSTDATKRARLSAERTSQLVSQSQDVSKISGQIGSSRGVHIRQELQQSIDTTQRARLSEDDLKAKLSSGDDLTEPICNAGDCNPRDNGDPSFSVPDVAAAIEDLLEQTSKIHDQKSPGRTGCDKIPFSSDCTTLREEPAGSHSVFGIPKNWLNGMGKRDDVITPPRDVNRGIYDGFSETQTESQVVVYEEDLSGRQMLIDRVRTRSSMA